MAGSPEVRLEHDDDGHAELVLAAPPGNKLHLDLLEQLVAVAERVHRQPPASLVVRGEGKAFCVGIDPAVFVRRTPGADQVVVHEPSVRHALERFSRLLGALEALPCPTVAALAGPALGGGLELALGCDRRVGSTTATLSMPEVRLGLLPGGGSTQRLARLLGAAKAKHLLLTGRRLSGLEAQRWGLVDVVVDRAEVVASARAEARRLAAAPRWPEARRALRRPQNWK